MLARRSSLIVLTNGVGALAGAVGLLLIGRFMTPASLGMYAFAASAASMLLFVANLGLDSAHGKRINQGLDVGTCIGTFTVMRIALTSGFLLVALGATMAWAATRGFHDATTLPVMVTGILYFTFLQLRGIPLATFNALRHTARAQVAVVTEHVFRLPLVALAAFAFAISNDRWVPGHAFFRRITPDIPAMDNEAGALALGAAFATAMFFSLAVAILLMRRHRYPEGRWDRGVARGYWAFALPVAVLSVIGTLTGQMDKVMLGFFWSAQEVGHYFGMERLVTLIGVVPLAVNTVFFPMVSELAATGSITAVRTVATTAARFVTLVMVGFAMLIIVFAPDIIHVALSDHYLAGADALRTLSVHAVVLSLTGIAIALVMALGAPGIAAGIGAASLVMNVLLNLFLIPRSLLGMPTLGLSTTGAALATLGGSTVTLAAVGWYLRRRIGYSSVPRATLHQAAAALVVGALLAWARAEGLFPQIHRVWGLAGAGLAGGALYGLALAATGSLTRKDFLVFLDVLHPGRLAQYVREELRVRR